MKRNNVASDVDIRLECLRLASSRGGGPREVLALASEYLSWVQADNRKAGASRILPADNPSRAGEPTE